MPGDATLARALIGGNQFYAPERYSAWWPIAGTAVLLLCLGWVAWVLVHTRPGNHAAVPAFAVPRDPETVRARFLALIDSLQSRYDAGALTARAAHLGFSAAVRSFVHEMTGVPAQRMTLAELRERQLPLVADAVAAFYPAEFGPADSGAHDLADGGPIPEAGPGVAASAATARAVVASWH
ncbi:hypothetical protein CVV68_10380 [Arthrobacter livingstonensis]|uniref:DUF4381 domain-containing protein n=1 Tax=Arthrobacter livingstonensis TaxID=670078 RepID=A0A2V5L878_9MICC|nr:hypothetical protein [Arthrobacter livingstonensis]PYI67488.1 hypothetical protein CVV68_10380 [Arthrobacter livingstonensis]